MVCFCCSFACCWPCNSQTLNPTVKTSKVATAAAQRLSPRDPRGWFASGAMAVAAIADENYLEAIQWAEKALTRNRRFAVALRVLIVALVKLDQKDRAGTIARELLEVEPELTISGFFNRIPFPRDTMATTYAEALRAAGVPE